MPRFDVRPAHGIRLAARAGLVSVAVCAAFLVGRSSSASSAGGLVPWAQKPSKECGQSCIYKKANENLSLEALYIMNKIDLLEGKDSDTILANLKQFCAPYGNDGKKCFSRYKVMAKERLEKIKAATVHNKRYVKDLDDAGASTIGYDGKGEGTPQVPYVPTFDEVAEEYRQTKAKMDSLANADYTNFIKTAAPDLSDFVKFKQQGNSKVEYDETAYQKAKDDYEKKYGKVMADEVKNVKLTPAALKKPETLDELSAGLQSINAYKAARDNVVETANKSLNKNAGSNEVKFRASAGQQSAKPALGMAKVLPPKPGDNTNIFINMEPETIDKEAQAINLDDFSP